MLIFAGLMAQHSSVIIIIGCRLYGWGLVPGMGWKFSHWYHIRTYSVPHPVSYPAGTSGTLSWLGHDDNIFPLSSVAVKNAWSFTYTLPHIYCIVMGYGHALASRREANKLSSVLSPGCQISFLLANRM